MSITNWSGLILVTSSPSGSSAVISVATSGGHDADGIAGHRRARLYAAFGDKRALFEAALACYIETYGAFTIQALRGETSARAAIARLLREAAVAFTNQDQPAGCLISSADANCSSPSASVQDQLDSPRSYSVRVFEEKIRGSQSSGLLAAQVDAHAFALFYSSVLRGMSAQERDGASRQEVEAVAEAALAAWPR